MKKTLLIAVSTLVTLCVPSAFAHTEDFLVGLNPATNHIQMDYDPALFPWELPASAWPAAAGFALDDPGFVSLTPDQVIPGEFETLNASAVIALKVLSTSSPEMKVWDPVGPGEPGFQVIGSNLWTIGAPFFDNHPVWHIDTADAAYDPGHGPWDVTFQLVDSAGIHLASEPITVSFTPEPMSFVGVVLSAAVARRRR